jgi:hypothetical protein
VRTVGGRSIASTLLVVAITLGACGGSSTASPPACVPGDQKACACTNGGQGVQVCSDDGTRYGVCMACPMGPGSAGSSGASGRGGSGGSAVVSGAAGSGGSTGGAAAVSGSGGSLAGTGGNAAAGTGGGPAAGTGGSAAGAGGSVTGSGGNSVAGSGGTSQSDAATQQYVSIELLQSLIGPTKSNGTEWDGLGGQVTSDIISGLTTALVPPGVASVVAFLATPAVQALSRPDPFGYAQLDIGNGTFAFDILLADYDTNMDDTFQPSWLNLRGWSLAPLNSRLRVRVLLLDEDFDADDSIGEATISGADIQAALSNGGTYWVRVETQTLRTILAIGIQVSLMQ